MSRGSLSLGRNVLWSLLAFAWLSLLVLLVTPFIVRRLGLDAFGVWAVLTAYAGTLSVVDLGIGNATVRHLAAEHERGDRGSLEALLRSAVSLQALLGLLAGAVFLALSPSIASRWLRVPPDLAGETLSSFRVTAATIALQFPAAVYAAVPAALRRFDLLAARNMLLHTIQYLAVVAVLAAGGGLVEVALVNAAAMAAILGYFAVVSARLLPGVRVGPGWSRGAARELLRFGRFKFASQLALQLLQQFDRLALAALVPVGRVSYYAIPVRIAQRLTQVVENIAAPFYPAVTSHLAAGRTEELRAQYRIGARLVAVVAFGAIAILGGFAGAILGVWMGRDFAREGAPSLVILLVAYSASALATLPSVAADAAGRPALPALFLVAGSLLHVALVLLWVPRFGLPGAALGVLAGFLLPLVLGVREIHRRVPSLPPALTMLANLRGAALAAGATGLAVVLFARRSPFPGSGVLPLLASLAAAGLLYGGLLLLFRGFAPDDLRRLARLLRRAGHAPDRD